jgi:hypothetical protein
MSPKEAFDCAKQRGFSPDLQGIIIESGDAELAYRFALDFADADLDALEQAIVGSGMARIAYDFALIKGERRGDVSRLQQVIIDADDPGLAILFAVDVNGADVELIEDYLGRHSDPKYAQLLEHELRQQGYY